MVIVVCFCWVRVEVDFASLPFFGDVHENGGDESQGGGFVWEEGGDAGSALDLCVEGFGHVGGAQALSHVRGEGEDGEGLGDGFFEPLGEFGGVFPVFAHSLFEALLGLGEGVGVEDAADVGGDLGAHGDFGDVCLCVAL